MSYKITIKYDASAVTVKEPDSNKVPTICDIFVPGSCAANMEAFEGSYYDTNTPGAMGEGTSLEDFMDMQVTHPGLVAAVRKAVRDGEYTYETDVPMADAFMDEVGKALKDYGITIETGDGSGDSTEGTSL